ncbi:MAG: endolytic transglycosylase MltG [Syntrophorhabdaceae bacterium]
MLAGRDKKILVIAFIVFIFSQSLIFASIPKGSDPSPRVVVIKSGTKLGQIADILKKEDLIYSKILFMAGSLVYRGRLIAGEYELRRDMSTIDIIRKMGEGRRNIYTLTIIEGHNIYTIAETMDKNRIMPKEEFLKLAKNKEYLKSIGITSASLEGYLYPDTYFYSKETDIEKFIERISRRALKIFEDPGVRQKMAALKMEIHTTITLASMIEKEASVNEEKPLVSAVFHNRIKKGMTLDCDPTVIYGTKGFGVPITKTDLLTYTPYNTYRFKGYPAGPIANPSKSSIFAALNPAAVDYLFFVSKNDGSHVFSRDMTEHNKYVKMYQRTRTTQ